MQPPFRCKWNECHTDVEPHQQRTLLHQPHLLLQHHLVPCGGWGHSEGEGQSVVTGPGATEYIITNLMNGTDSQVELFGFTSSDPVVYSEVATVNITTEGVYMS